MKETKEKKYCKAIILLVIFLFTSDVYCELINFKNDYYWIDAGISSYNSDNSNGAAWVIGLNRLNNHLYYKLRNINYSEYILFDPKPAEHFNETSFLLGKALTLKNYRFKFSGGLGVIVGKKRGELIYTEYNPGWFSINDKTYYETSTFVAPCIPLSLDIQYFQLKYVGLELSLHGNLNWQRPLFGLNCNLVFGKLK